MDFWLRFFLNISFFGVCYFLIFAFRKGFYTTFVAAIVYFVSFLPVNIYSFFGYWPFPTGQHFILEKIEEYPDQIFNHLAIIYIISFISFVTPYLVRAISKESYKTSHIITKFHDARIDQVKVKIENNFVKKDLIYFLLLLISVFFTISFFRASSSTSIINSTYSQVMRSESYDSTAETFFFLTQILIIYILVLVGYGKQKNTLGIIKNICYLIVLIWILILDVLNGDRTSFGLILGLISLSLYFYKLKGSRSEISISPLKVFLFFPFIVLIAYLLGLIRIVSIKAIVQNPILIYNLAKEYLFFSLPSNGGLRQLIGQAVSKFEFINNPDSFIVLISHLKLLIPSFIRDLIWSSKDMNFFDTDFYIDYTPGGANIATLPYELFGYYGIFFTLVIFSFIILKLELGIMKENTYFPLITSLILISFLPRIAWYGYGYLMKFISLIPFIYFSLILLRKKV